MENKIKTKKRACPLCKESIYNKELFYNSKPWKLVQCRCSFVYMPEVPIYERLKSEFSWERNFDKEENISFKKKIRRKVKAFTKRDKLKYLLNYYVKKGNVLDVGCGSGVKFENISDDFVPFGIDISEESAKKANLLFEKRGGKAICAPSTKVLDEFGDNKFSGAILRSYLEHEHEPFEVLKNLRLTLKDKARVIIKVPNYDSINRKIRKEKWCGFHFPDHVNHFTPKTLLKMVKDTNYDVIKFNFLDYLPTSDNMWMVVKPSLHKSMRLNFD